MEGLDGRNWWNTYQQDEVLTLAGVSPGSGVLHQEVKMDLQETVFDKEAFREELRTQKLKVAKLEEQNLEIRKIRQDLKDSRTMVHAKDVETQKFGMQLQKY